MPKLGGCPWNEPYILWLALAQTAKSWGLYLRRRPVAVGRLGSAGLPGSTVRAVLAMVMVATI